ncbi:MAG: hypothetical protein N3A38_11415 [Planctomycetota bacterium]|nr:hypothetical protein [Planctomycetota bacterium]
MDRIPRILAVTILLSAAATAAGHGTSCGEPGHGAERTRGEGGLDPDEEKIAQAVARLGHEEFEVREQAAEFLWRCGARAEKSLRKALASPDPEVVSRARMILERLEFGLTPDTRKELIELVARYRDSGGEDRVLTAREMENFGEEAIPVLLVAAGREKGGATRREVLASLERCALRLSRERIEAGETDRAEGILSRAASGSCGRMLHHYAAFLMLIGRLQEKIAELEAAVGKGGDVAREAAARLAFFRAAAGDMEGAEKAARLSGRENILEGVLLERGKWDELAPRLLARIAGTSGGGPTDRQAGSAEGANATGDSAAGTNRTGGDRTAADSSARAGSDRPAGGDPGSEGTPEKGGSADGGGRTADAKGPENRKNLQDIALRAAICRLARDGRGYEKAAAELAEAAAATVATGGAADANTADPARLLLLTGKVREAVRLLEAAGRLDAVRDIHASRLSLREALAAAVKAAGGGPGIPPEEDPFLPGLSAARLYVETGEDEKADAAIVGLLRCEKSEFHRGEDDTLTDKALRLSRLIETARECSPARAFDICLDAIFLAGEEVEREMWPVAALFPGQEEEAAAWWYALRTKRGGGARGGGPAEASGGAGEGADAGKSSGFWKRLRRVLAGPKRKVRGGKDPEEVRKALEKLRRILAREADAREVATLAEEALKTVREVGGAEADRIGSEHLLAGFAATCDGYGLDAKAMELLDAAERRIPSAERHVLAGDFRAVRGRWADAAEKYLAAWDLERLGSFPDALPLFLYGKAMAGAGKHDEGRKAIAKARLLLLADGGARLEIRTGLAERLMEDEAARELEIAVRTRHFAGVLPDQGAPILNLCERETDAVMYPREAAAAAERRLLGLLADEDERMSCNWSECLAAASEVHMARPLRAVADGDISAAMGEADAAMEILPGEIRLPIALAASLDRAGRRKEADGIVERAYRFLSGICSKDSGSARHCNNLAWMLAKCRRRLDDALALAGRAVSLDPCNQYYLDTLAEVHFQRGDRGKAIELAKKCVSLNPWRVQWRAQLARFEKSSLGSWP